jgi:beta-glucosidase
LGVYYNHPNGSSWHQGESVGFPDYVDCPHTPRYFFGHGLSYTKFEYSDLVIGAGEGDPATPSHLVAVSFRVANAGARAGTEIVQLYFRYRYAQRARPVQELAGFCRVALVPGESRTVCFTIDTSLFAFCDANMDWLVEAGDFDLWAGASSEDIRLSGTITLAESRHVGGRSRAMLAAVQVS